MSKETREHLSCLVDGEIGRETSRFLVSRLAADQELRATWTRYHLVRDCLRHQDGAVGGEDLCDRVGQALADETPARPARRLSAAWLKPAAGLAIAASVALMAIVAIGPGAPGTQQVGDGLAGSAAGPESFTSPQGLMPVPYSSQASGNRKMDSYLVRHYQASGSAGGRGFVAFVPIVIDAAAATQVAEDEAARESVKDDSPADQ